MTKNLLIFAVILVAVVFVAFFSFSGLKSGSKKTASFGDNIINLEIADTPDKQRNGLSNRDSLAEDTGMLFVFKDPGNYNFWMKDMRFPLDIIFLRDEKVITIYRDVQPAATDPAGLNLALYSPREPADRVLEVNAGTVAKLNLNEGDTLKINL